MSAGSPAEAVAVNVASPTPETTACAVLAPVPGPRVQLVDARPFSSVVPVAGSSEPPPAVTTQVTAAPTTAFPPPSTTSTTSGSGSVVPGSATCSLPETIRTLEGFPAVAVWVKITGDPARPSELAVVVCGAEAGPSVRSTELWPSASVSVDGSLTLPPPSTVQVMRFPAIGLPNASVTSTTSGAPNVVPAAPCLAIAGDHGESIGRSGEGDEAEARGRRSLSGSMTLAVPWVSPTCEPSVISLVTCPDASVLAVSGSALPAESSITTVAFSTPPPAVVEHLDHERLVELLADAACQTVALQNCDTGRVTRRRKIRPFAGEERGGRESDREQDSVAHRPDHTARIVKGQGHRSQAYQAIEYKDLDALTR